MLITSRTVWEELNLPRIQRLEVLAPAAARQLLLDVVADQWTGETILTSAQADALAAAAHYHPRLMRIASGWLNAQQPADVVAALHQLPALRAQGDPLIEKALQELIGRTLDLMQQQPGGAPAYHLLRRLVVCWGGFTSAAATALAPAGTSLLAPLLLLVRWNLLRYDRASARYDTDPLVRDAVEVDSAAYSLHYEYYLALARQYHNQQVYLKLDFESANLAAAFEWALGVGEIERAYWLINTASNLFYNRGRSQQAVTWYERVAMAWPPDTTAELRAGMHNDLGLAYWNLSKLEDQSGNLHRAIAAYRITLRHHTEAAAPLAFAGTQNNLGNVYRKLLSIEGETTRTNIDAAVAAY